MSSKEYENLHKISAHAKVLAGVSSLLEWDQETYMPPGGAQNRSNQIKALAGIIHKERTSKKFASALDKLIDLKTGKIQAKGLTAAQQAAAKMWRRDYLHDIALP